MKKSSRARSLVLALGVLGAATFVTPAQAATTFGSNAGPYGATCNPGFQFVSTSAATPGAGVVTSLVFESLGSNDGQQADFQMLHPNGDGTYTVLGGTGLVSLNPGTNTFTTSIPVQAGDVAGFFANTSFTDCAGFGGPGSYAAQFVGSDPAVGTVVIPSESGTGITLNVSGVLNGAPTDTTPPACGSLTVAPGAGSATISPTDADSGLATISNLKISNGTGTVAPFSPGASSTTITVSKTNPALKTVFNFDVTDVAGNTTHCS